MIRVLFISHDASRTGAPILLLRLLEQIKKTGTFEIIVLLNVGGVLEKEFRLMGKTFVWNSAFNESFVERWGNRIRNRLGIRTVTKQDKYRRHIANEVKSVDFVFSNTIANTNILKLLPIHEKRVICYIHELMVITQMVTSREDVKYLDSISGVILVPANAVKTFLQNEYNIQGEKIKLLKYIVAPARLNKVASNHTVEHKNDSKFLVGFCGTLNWRKGYDLLPLIVNTLVNERKLQNVHFMWIGANTQYHDYLILKNDLVKLDIDSYVTFVESQGDIEPYLAELDVLALPSREDAFPLVVLEAARYEVPCVYFEHAGGIGEFCGKDAGIPVAYMDINSMVDAIVSLKVNKPLKERLGEMAKVKVREYEDAEQIVTNLLSHFQMA